MQTTTVSPPMPNPTGTVMRRRLESAKALLRNCEMCELRCGADRTAGEPSPCGLGADSYVYKCYRSLNEEAELAPALRVFLGGCNLRCRFCDEAPECFQPAAGRLVDPSLWASELVNAVDHGAKSISVLGGEPTLHVHTLLATAAEFRRPVPLALNTNMYMTPEVLDLLDGVVTTYLADFKFGNDACALALAGVPRYTEIVHRNLRRACASTDVIVRHVLVPGHFECCFRPVVDWLSRELPGTRFQLYSGYVPCWRAASDARIGRLNSREEEHDAKEYLRNTDLRCEASPG